LTHKSEQFVLGLIKCLLTLIELWVIRIVVPRVLAPRPGCAVGSGRGSSDAAISIEAQACELGERIRVPVERQFRSAIKPVAMGIGSLSQCLDGLVEVLEDLSSVLESPSFVLTSPSLLFSLSFPCPGLILALASPSLDGKGTYDASDQSAQDTNTGNDERHPEGCTAHASMMEVSTANSLVMGHIGDTPARDLPGNAENCRDLNRRSGSSHKCIDRGQAHPGTRPGLQANSLTLSHD